MRTSRTNSKRCQTYLKSRTPPISPTSSTSCCQKILSKELAPTEVQLRSLITHGSQMWPPSTLLMLRASWIGLNLLSSVMTSSWEVIWSTSMPSHSASTKTNRWSTQRTKERLSKLRKCFHNSKTMLRDDPTETAQVSLSHYISSFVSLPKIFHAKSKISIITFIS